MAARHQHKPDASDTLSMFKQEPMLATRMDHFWICAQKGQA